MAVCCFLLVIGAGTATGAVGARLASGRADRSPMLLGTQEDSESGPAKKSPLAHSGRATTQTYTRRGPMQLRLNRQLEH